ncbi:thioredoxin family protein [Flaviaesturariibacter flavus]|uniref:Thioredoxin family protein n=1 Tax=Flaviaesturariibacter flavus TaxID=2502780 RepID=A0A4R1BJG2_9BACT|nr:thioredoxin family protein [Flaviaesturariibacter flavus]TCJ17473.1 thioredoxin family protein [Flaviaesturariibacter flavus]
MRRILSATVLSLLLAGAAAAQIAASPELQAGARIASGIQTEAPAIPSADAVLAEARKVAAADKKKILVLFHASWCGWCKKLEKALDDPEMKPLFQKNYVIRWLTVYESPNKKALENPGAEDLLKQYKGNDQGIPYFLVFDGKGKMLADSQKSPGENIGCPAEPDEIAHFVKVLRKTGQFTDSELQQIAERFKKNKS